MAGVVNTNIDETDFEAFDFLEEEDDFFDTAVQEEMALGLPSVMTCTKVTKFSDTTEEADSLFTDAFASAARRPLRGIQFKKESIATLYLKSKSKRLKNSSVDGDEYFTTNFLVNSISENRQEKHQTVLTFGKDYVYFFGEQPRQVTINATLLNSANFR